MDILFLSRWFPYPPDNGSRTRVLHLLKELGLRWNVDLVSFSSETIADEQLAEVHRICRRVDVIPYPPYHPDRWAARLAALTPRPRYLAAVESAGMHARLKEIARQATYDVVVASQLDMLPYGAKFPAAVRIAEEMELTVFHDQVARATSATRKFRSQLMWWKLVRYVADLLRHYQGITVASVVEQKLLRSIVAPGLTVSIVPNGVDVAACSTDFGLPEPDTLVYSGALTYQANFDAVNFFLREVFPHIVRSRPGVRLYVTGRLDGVAVERLPQYPNVVFTGYLPNVRPRVAQSWLCVVPLRVGGGTRLKVLEALALGTPVVSTLKGVEGLDLQPGRDLLVADGPAEFASGVLRVLSDRILREQLSVNGRRASIQYDWSDVGRRLTNMICSMSTPRSETQTAGWQ